MSNANRENAKTSLTLGLETSTHSGGAALMRLEQLQPESATDQIAENSPGQKEASPGSAGGPPATLRAAPAVNRQDACTTLKSDPSQTADPPVPLQPSLLYAGLVGSATFTTKQLYSQRLLPTIEWLLERTQIQVADITAIGISIGPGSFTGLRIGLSVAKALAYASGASIVGVSTLEALAVRAASGRDALVCPLLDARQGQVYAALYRVSWSADGLPQVETVREDWAGPVEQVAEWITEPVLFAGDALPLAHTHLRPVLKDNFLLPGPHHRLPHPEEVALLAATRAAAGQVDNPLKLEPKYVRQSYTQR